MMLGSDAVQMEAYGCRLMGLKLDDVPYIALAEKLGAGSSKVTLEDIIKLNEPEESSLSEHFISRTERG